MMLYVVSTAKGAALPISPVVIAAIAAVALLVLIITIGYVKAPPDQA